MTSRRFIPLFASLLLVAPGHAGKIDGYDSKTIETALEGRKIVVQVGCLEEPRLNEGIMNIFEKHYPGRSEDDSTFRAAVTKAFFAGLAKKAGARIEFDSLACRTGSTSKVVADLDGHNAMLDGSRISGSKAYLALGFFLYESPSSWERHVFDDPKYPTGAHDQSIGARMSYGIYDTQERLLVYYATEKVTAVDDLILIKFITPEHWERAATRLGEKIGAKIAKLPGK